MLLFHKGVFYKHHFFLVSYARGNVAIVGLRLTLEVNQASFTLPIFSPLMVNYQSVKPHTLCGAFVYDS